MKNKKHITEWLLLLIVIIVTVLGWKYTWLEIPALLAWVCLWVFLLKTKK